MNCEENECDVVNVYVDELFRAEAKGRAAFAVGARNGHQWCHMADRLGLQRSWFQEHDRVPHYDLTPGKRLQALKLGAVEKDLREWFREKNQGMLSAEGGTRNAEWKVCKTVWDDLPDDGK